MHAAAGLVLALAIATCSCEPLRKGVNSVEEYESCESHCELTYPAHTYPKPEHLDACKKGCRNFVEAGFHAVTHDMNATHVACFNACTEAYPSQPSYYACTEGCDEQFRHVSKMQSEHKKTSHLHPLKLLMLVQKMYETVVDHVCRIIRRTFYAVYVQKDTGHLVVVRGELTPIRILDPHAGDPAEDKPAKPASSTKSEQEAAAAEASSTVSAAASSSFSWLDCISRQSGIPEWLLVMVLFLVVVTMVWLCCATMVSSPSSSVTSTSPPPAYSHHKMGVSGDLDYLLIYDPSEQVKIQPPVDQEAPPLPVKVPLSQI